MKTSIIYFILLFFSIGLSYSDDRLLTVVGGEYWTMKADDSFLKYLEDARPDVVHCSILGPEMFSIVGSGIARGITAVYPENVATSREYVEWWKEYLKKIHSIEGVKAQTTFSLGFVWGDVEKKTGWFDYYENRWEKELLGEKPAIRATDILEIDSAGKPIEAGKGNYACCVNNPEWREILKRMVKLGIETGFDGFMTQFNYKHDCFCKYCVAGFREFLKKKYNIEELLAKFGIKNIEEWQPPTTLGREGFPEKIDFEARGFSNISIKECFDEVFVKYGRGLKKDLILSGWYHFRQFLSDSVDNDSASRIFDERLFLPVESWSKDEDYIWYSIGNESSSSDLTKKFVGDSAMHAKYIYGISEKKPFVVCKYDVRQILPIAEAMSHNGMALDAYRWDTETVKTLFGFIRKNEELFTGVEPYSEVGMIFPRRNLINNDGSFLKEFKKTGRYFLNNGILFDILIDEKMKLCDTGKYKALILFSDKYLTGEELDFLRSFVEKGGFIIQVKKEYDNSLGLSNILFFRNAEEAGMFFSNFRDKIDFLSDFSEIKVPEFVQTSVFSKNGGKKIIVHFINFNRDEKKQGLENPLPVDSVIAVKLNVDGEVGKIFLLNPEDGSRKELLFRQESGKVYFDIPGFRIWTIAEIELK